MRPCRTCIGRQSLQQCQQSADSTTRHFWTCMRRYCNYAFVCCIQFVVLQNFTFKCCEDMLQDHHWKPVITAMLPKCWCPKEAIEFKHELCSQISVYASADCTMTCYAAMRHDPYWKPVITAMPANCWCQDPKEATEFKHELAAMNKGILIPASVRQLQDFFFSSPVRGAHMHSCRVCMFAALVRC